MESPVLEVAVAGWEPEALGFETEMQSEQAGWAMLKAQPGGFPKAHRR